MNKLYSILIFGLIVVAKFNCPTYSQIPDTVMAHESKKSTIAALVSFHSFLDDIPSISPGVQAYRVISRPSFGVGYSRSIDAKSGLIFTLKYYPAPRFSFFNTAPCTREAQVLTREFAIVEAIYGRHIFGGQKLHIFGVFGLNFRYGFELLASCDSDPNSFEPDNFPLRDIGLVAGLRGVVPLSKRLELSGELKFTEFIYRRAHYLVPWYSNWARHGSTRHMLTLQLGLGYRF